MNWFLLIAGGYLLGRVATGETAQEAIEKTIDLPRGWLAEKEIPVSIGEEEDSLSKDISIYCG